MPTMGSYCKAYSVDRLAEFPGWSDESIVPPAPNAAKDTEDPGVEVHGRYLFLQADFTVTGGIFMGEDVAFNTITDEWKNFCIETLKFEVPQVCDTRPPVPPKS